MYNQNLMDHNGSLVDQKFGLCLNVYFRYSKVSSSHRGKIFQNLFKLFKKMSSI